MQCPHDGAEMSHADRHGVAIDHCPVCGGVWLDRGELDHLIEAVRPALALDDPEPAAAPPPRPRAVPTREAETHGARYAAKAPNRAVRIEDRGQQRDPEPGKGRRYGGKHSRKSRVRDILEEIFDFD